MVEIEGMKETHSMVGFKQAFESLLLAVREEALSYYGDRLVSLAVFGSVGRGTMRPDSDVDLLVVADPLPVGRLRRVEDFAPIETRLVPVIENLRARGVTTGLAPLFKTPVEIAAHSPILLDMTEDARILFDRDNFLRRELDTLADGLRRLGAKRHFVGSAWWWDLKPDFKCGDVVVL
jgi:predicted nucleotidyltransferase